MDGAEATSLIPQPMCLLEDHMASIVDFLDTQTMGRLDLTCKFCMAGHWWNYVTVWDYQAPDPAVKRLIRHHRGIRNIEAWDCLDESQQELWHLVVQQCTHVLCFDTRDKMKDKDGLINLRVDPRRIQSLKVDICKTRLPSGSYRNLKFLHLYLAGFRASEGLLKRLQLLVDNTGWIEYLRLDEYDTTRDFVFQLMKANKSSLRRATIQTHGKHEKLGYLFHACAAAVQEGDWPRCDSICREIYGVGLHVIRSGYDDPSESFWSAVVQSGQQKQRWEDLYRLCWPNPEPHSVERLHELFCLGISLSFSPADSDSYELVLTRCMDLLDIMYDQDYFSRDISEAINWICEENHPVAPALKARATDLIRRYLCRDSHLLKYIRYGTILFLIEECGPAWMEANKIDLNYLFMNWDGKNDEIIESSRSSTLAYIIKNAGATVIETLCKRFRDLADRFHERDIFDAFCDALLNSSRQSDHMGLIAKKLMKISDGYSPLPQLCLDGDTFCLLLRVATQSPPLLQEIFYFLSTEEYGYFSYVIEALEAKLPNNTDEYWVPREYVDRVAYWQGALLLSDTEDQLQSSFRYLKEHFPPVPEEEILFADLDDAEDDDEYDVYGIPVAAARRVLRGVMSESIL